MRYYLLLLYGAAAAERYMPHVKCRRCRRLRAALRARHMSRDEDAEPILPTANIRDGIQAYMILRDACARCVDEDKQRTL